MSRQEGRDRNFGGDIDQSSYNKLKRQVDNVNRKLERKQSELDSVREQNKLLDRDKKDLIKELEDHHIHHHDGEEYVPAVKDDSETLEKLEKFEERETLLYSRIGSLREKIQRESIREVKER